MRERVSKGERDGKEERQGRGGKRVHKWSRGRNEGRGESRLVPIMLA